MAYEIDPENTDENHGILFFFSPEKVTKASASHHSNHWDITLEDMWCWLAEMGDRND